MWTGCSPPSGPATTARIGAEYLVPKWKMWPTSMPRAESLVSAGSASKAAASCFSEVAA